MIIDKVVVVIDVFVIDYYVNLMIFVLIGGNEGWGGWFGNIGYVIYWIES